jgi:hypothetical protein
MKVENKIIAISQLILILLLSITNPCPTQNLDPKEKGIKAKGCLVAFATPLANCSGLNS